MATLSAGCTAEPNVYVAGWEDTGTGRAVKLWKNGIPQKISNGKGQDVVALCVFVSAKKDV